MFSQTDGGASFHELPHLAPLLPFSHDVHGRQTHQIPLQLLLQPPLLSCACEHALGLSLPCASHAIKPIAANKISII